MSSKQMSVDSNIYSHQSHREVITEIFYNECMKLGKWQPFEDMNNENPLFWWLGNGFYKCRDSCLSLFTKYPFSKIELSLGEFLVHFLFITLTLGFNIYCGIITYNNAASKSTGLMASISMLLVFVFSGKMSIWNVLFGLPHERQLQFHKNASVCMVVSSVVHGVFKGIKEWQGITGLVFGIVLFLLLLCVVNFVRRYRFIMV